MALVPGLGGKTLGTLVGAAKRAFPASDSVIVGMGRGRRALPSGTRALPSGARAIGPPPRMQGPAIPMGPTKAPRSRPHGPGIPMGPPKGPAGPVYGPPIPGTQNVPVAATNPPKGPGFFAQHGKKVAAAVAVGAVGFGAMNNRSGKGVDPQTGLPRGIYGR
jgi:hypothetical protein